MVIRYKISGNGVNKINEDGSGSYFEGTDSIEWPAYQAWLSEGNTTEPEFTKEEAYKNKTELIGALSLLKQSGTFDYNGSIFTLMKINKVIKDKAADKTKTFKVLDINGTIHSFNKTEYEVYGNTMIDAIDVIEDQEIVHREALKVIYDNPASTADDILNYDITQGW